MFLPVPLFVFGLALHSSKLSMCAGASLISHSIFPNHNIWFSLQLLSLFMTPSCRNSGAELHFLKLSFAKCD